MKAQKYDREIFQALWMAYRPYRWVLGISMLAGFLGRLFLMANANIIGRWVDELTQGKADTAFYLTLLGVSVGLGFALTWYFRLAFSRVSALAVSRLYDEVTLRTSRFPMSFFDRTPVGQIVTRFSSDYGNVFRLFGGPLAEFLSILFDIVCIVLLVTLASPWFLPWLLLFALLHTGVYWLHRDRLRDVRRQLSSSRSPSVAHFSETVQGSSTIRSFERQRNFIDRFERLDNVFLSKRMKTVKAVLKFSLQMNLLTGLLFLAAGAFAYHMVQTQQMTIGAVGVAFGLITLSGNTILMFFEWLAQVEEALIGVERMNTYLQRKLELGSHLPPEATFRTDHPQLKSRPPQLVWPRAAEVRIEDLSFRYLPEGPSVLKDLQVQIKAGERLGVVGRTGSGKSTLTQVLLHLYPLEKGRIFIDGKAPHLDLSRAPLPFEVPLEEFRRSISFIPQEPILFRGTLRENLDFEGLHSDEALKQALEKVGLESWTLNLDRIIEERARNLSLGERQLICIARALIQEAPVVIMDEATSSVDPQSEEILVRATDEFFSDRTQIIIAHRLSTLQSCDRVLWLHQGHLKALGPTAEVLSTFQKTDLSLALPVLPNRDD